MAKVLSAILSGPIGLIDKKLGQQISGIGLTAIGFITGNPFALAAGSFQLQQAFTPPIPKPEQTETAIMAPVPPRVSGYGINRLYMAFALYITAKTDEAIDVGALHDGRINAIRGYYLGDKKVAINASGWVQRGEDEEFGKNSDKVRILTRSGLPTETAFAEVIALAPDQWTANHRGDGVCTAAAIWKSIKASDFQKVYPSGGPNGMPLSMVMELQPVYDWRDPSQNLASPGTWKWSENVFLHLAHYLLVRDNKSWAKHFAPTLAYWTAAADDADSPVPLKGVQTILTMAAGDGAGTINVLSVNGLAVGMTITVSATGNTSLTETRVVTSINGLTIGFSGSLNNEHPVGSQVAWASSAGAPATEPRYRSCVVHKHTDEHKAVIAALLACGDGWMSPRADGALVVYSGRYYEPTVTLTDADIINLSIQDGIEEESAINQIPLTYVSANHNYSTVDTDAWTDESDISRRGKILASPGLANQVPSHPQARRLGKRAYAEANAFPRGTSLLRGTKNARKILGQRYVRIRSASAGIDEVVQVRAPVKRSPLTGQISFAFLKADPLVDVWNPATEEGNPAPVGNRTPTAALDAPTITSSTPTYGQNTAYNTPGVKLTLIVAGPDRDDLIWYVRTRPVGGVSWLEQQYADIDPGPSVTLQTDFLPVGELEVEAAYMAGDGRLSPWGSNGPVNTDTQLPAALTGLSVSTNEDGTLIAADWFASQNATSYLLEVIVEAP